MSHFFIPALFKGTRAFSSFTLSCSHGSAHLLGPWLRHLLVTGTCWVQEGEINKSDKVPTPLGLTVLEGRGNSHTDKCI